MGTLIPRVACVSFVSRQYLVNAAETYEAVRSESGVRYHHTRHRTDIRRRRVGRRRPDGDLRWFDGRPAASLLPHVGPPRVAD